MHKFKNRDEHDDEDFQRVYEGGSSVTPSLTIENRNSEISNQISSTPHKMTEKESKAQASKWWKWKPDHMMEMKEAHLETRVSAAEAGHKEVRHLKYKNVDKIMKEVQSQNQKMMTEVIYADDIEHVTGVIEPPIKSSFFDDKDTKLEDLQKIFHESTAKIDLGEDFKAKNASFITYKDEYFVIVVGVIKDKYKFKNTVLKIISVDLENKQLGEIVHDV